MKKGITLSDLRKHELERIFEKNSEYIEFVIKSTLRTNAELYLKQILNQFKGTKLHLSYKIYYDDQYHIEIDSELKGDRKDLEDLIYGFHDVYPDVLDDELLELCEDMSADVVELETAFINAILNSVMSFLKISDWKDYFLKNTSIFDGMEYGVAEDFTLFLPENREENPLN